MNANEDAFSSGTKNTFTALQQVVDTADIAVDANPHGFVRYLCGITIGADGCGATASYLSLSAIPPDPVSYTHLTLPTIYSV